MSDAPDDGRDGPDLSADADAGEDADSREDAESAEEATAADDSQWQFSLADLERREDEAEAAAEAQRKRNEPLEAGDPSLENTAFVLLGVLLTLFIISRLFLL